MGRFHLGDFNSLPRRVVNDTRGRCIAAVFAAPRHELLRGTRSACYVAFDLLWLNRADLRSLPLSERRRELKGILPDRSRLVSEAISVVGRARDLFELMREHDPEGIVAQRLDDAYDPRIRWLKVKSPDYSQKEGATGSTGRSGPCNRQASSRNQRLGARLPRDGSRPSADLGAHWR